jgi:acylphosphatase
MKRLKITVRGRVQGVFFRDSTRNKASELGICGFVCNQPDGAVYIEAEGDDTPLAQFVQWCREGPQLARVAEVDVDDCESVGDTKFIIKF